MKKQPARTETITRFVRHMRYKELVAAELGEDFIEREREKVKPTIHYVRHMQYKKLLIEQRGQEFRDEAIAQVKPTKHVIVRLITTNGKE